MHRILWWVKVCYSNSCTHVQSYLSLWKCFTTEEHDVRTQYTCTWIVFSIFACWAIVFCSNWFLSFTTSSSWAVACDEAALECSWCSLVYKQQNLYITLSWKGDPYTSQQLLTSLLLFEEGRYCTHELLNSIAYISTGRKWVPAAKCTVPNSKVHSVCALFRVMQWLYSNQSL